MQALQPAPRNAISLHAVSAKDAKAWVKARGAAILAGFTGGEGDLRALPECQRRRRGLGAGAGRWQRSAGPGRLRREAARGPLSPGRGARDLRRRPCGIGLAARRLCVCALQKIFPQASPAGAAGRRGWRGNQPHRRGAVPCPRPHQHPGQRSGPRRTGSRCPRLRQTPWRKDFRDRRGGAGEGLSYSSRRWGRARCAAPG